jgi:Holliday junction DNA helicase RuvA
MFGKLTGIVEKNDFNTIILDVQGVGYLINCLSSTIDKLNNGDKISLSIETIVREDSIKLYGFLNKNDKFWFNRITTVQGVGFKVALAILNTLSVEELNYSILSGDKAMISRADGVGPKLASRIILELKDKISDLSVDNNNIDNNQNSSKDINDAISALTNLGYQKAKVYQIVRSIEKYDDINDLIKQSLKLLTM